jgi:sigma-B regulation protein RsbU (phosphoserine phosphatase)
MKNRWFLVLTGLFFVVQFLYAGSGIYQSFTAPTPLSDPGWIPADAEGRVVVLSPGEGPSPLKAGDEIVAIDGSQFNMASQAMTAMRQLPPGAAYSVLIRRGGQLGQFVLHTEPVPLIRIALIRAALAIILTVFLITGFAVFLLKPYDKQALLLAWMFGMFTGLVSPISPEISPWLVGAVAISRIISILALPIFLHFFLTFPEESPLLRRFPKLEVYLYLPFLVTFFPYWAVAVIFNVAPGIAPLIPAKLALLGRVGAPLIIMYIGGGLLSLLVNYRQAATPSRRKMKVIVAGSMAGFVPGLVFISMLNVFGSQHISPILIQWMGALVLFAFPLFPLSFAYAIVRHQVIPVRLILRRGVRYVFVSQGSIVLELVAVFLTLTFLLYSFFTYLHTSSELEIGIVSGVVSIIVWEITGYLHRRVIAPAIDRRFFRQAYNAQQILSELGNALRYMTDLREMTSLARSKVQDALHTENAMIFLPDPRTGNYVCEGQPDNGGGSEDVLALPADGSVLKRLRNSTMPLAVDFDDPRSWAGRLAAASIWSNQAHRAECEALKRAKSALLLPISTKDHLYGIVAVGKRLGDLPFSREDKQLLSALAWQMAFAVENSLLVRRMAEEQRLRHELEMATEVQRRLFPERPPLLASAELYGICLPARGVGGDYYDFLDLGEGQLGIAVADVAGKGISAALLMSIVQASLRSQAPSVNGRLTDLVSSMNRLLHRSTGASGYASFFYAQYDERRSVLTYVNAGHNPPILVKSRQRQPLDMTSGGSALHAKAAQTRSAEYEAAALLTRDPSAINSTEAGLLTEEAGTSFDEEMSSPLTTGGLVIGLFDESTYDQESIDLISGDLLVAYTDGITEALNSQGDEFGEGRLRQIVIEGASLGADELSGRIIGAIDNWCAGLQPHDDLTLVIMKMK